MQLGDTTTGVDLAPSPSRPGRASRPVAVLIVALIGAVGVTAYLGTRADRDATRTIASAGENGAVRLETREFSLSLPAGFEFVDESDGAHDGYAYTNGTSSASGEQWPNYVVRFARGGASALAADHDSTPIIAVTAVHGAIYTAAELGATNRSSAVATNRFRDATVRGGKAALEVTTGDGWLAIEWNERENLGFAVTGFGVTFEQLRAVVESLEPGA